MSEGSPPIIIDVLRKLTLYAAVLALFASGLSVTEATEAYKCVDSEGKITFSGLPCANQGSQDNNVTQNKITVSGGKSEIDNLWMCDKSVDNPLFQPISTQWEALSKSSKPSQWAEVEGIFRGIALASKESIQKTTVARDEKQQIHICTPHKVPAANGAPKEGFLEYVVQADGRVIEKRLSGKIKFYNDAANDPFTLQRRCGDLITACYQPKGPGHSLDECFAAAPVCPEGKLAANAQCCPGTCFQEYREKRARGIDPLSAQLDALFSNHSCIPGISESLGVKE